MSWKSILQRQPPGVCLCYKLTRDHIILVHTIHQNASHIFHCSVLLSSSWLAASCMEQWPVSFLFSWAMFGAFTLILGSQKICQPSGRKSRSVVHCHCSCINSMHRLHSHSSPTLRQTNTIAYVLGHTKLSARLSEQRNHSWPKDCNGSSWVIIAPSTMPLTGEVVFQRVLGTPCLTSNLH